jgi:hypothetical protein
MSLRLQPSDFGLADDPKRPVLSALGRACADNMSDLAAVVEQARALATAPDLKTGEAEVMRLLEKAKRHIQNVAELLRWIKLRKALSIEDATRQAEAFRELGDEWVQKLRHSMQTVSEGKPAIKRESHIRAFEFMLQSQNNSLGKATKKFCSCGNKRHDTNCPSRFKSGIRALKKVLRKYTPHLAMQYDSLHPDRKTIRS